jgi:hypothetical protein
MVHGACKTSGGKGLEDGGEQEEVMRVCGQLEFELNTFYGTIKAGI